MKQPESKLQREIRTALEREFGGFFFKTHGSMFQMVGLPDLVGVAAGVFIGVEVKMPRKDPNPRQRMVLKLIKRAGGVACVARSPKTAIIRVRRGIRSHYDKIIKDKTIPFSKESSQVRRKKKKLRVVHAYEDGEDSHYAVNPNKVVAKEGEPFNPRPMSKERH